ncbi:MAG: N-acetyltransferase [Candidatus Odinarchaeota archaeon]|nr:N-acetyltransferase [Candidatus Odinarchaeota archaeon]
MKYFVHDTAVVEEGAVVGDGTKIWHHAHVRSGAKIGKNCVLGKSVYVDKGVVIGDNVKLENRVSVFQGVTIEDDVFIGPHTTFTNDRYPRAFNKDWEIVRTYVEKGASIGAGAVIVCGVRLGKYCMVGAGAVVTKDVPPFTLVLGVPARIVGFVCYCGKPLKEIVREDEKEVVFRCSDPKCGREVHIPKETYNLVRKDDTKEG